MVDPLAEVVLLLQPTARFSKNVIGAGAWQVHRSDAGQPFYCAVLEGSCRLTLDGREPLVLEAGDFALVPAAFGVTMSSLEVPTDTANALPVELSPGIFRIGDAEKPIDLRILAGHCSFGSQDAALLVSLLPELVHLRGEERLATLVHLVGQESRERRPARELILTRLLEVLLIEALRSNASAASPPGLVRALTDARLAAAIRAMHEQPARPWTVIDLAKAAALSRTTFFERFSCAVGKAPMAYLLAWRMALAKDMLRRRKVAIADVAERVGYASASTFSVAFSRYVGKPPAQYARESEDASQS